MKKFNNYYGYKDWMQNDYYYKYASSGSNGYIQTDLSYPDIWKAQMPDGGILIRIDKSQIYVAPGDNLETLLCQIIEIIKKK